MEQMMAEIKAETGANQAKSKVNRREMRASQYLLKYKMVAKIETYQE
jgi:hypothetical protein